LDEGLAAALETLGDMVVTAHVHDNHGFKDEHLPPFEGDIDWKSVLPKLAKLPMVMELKEQPAHAEPAPATVALDVVRAAFERLEAAIEPSSAE
jgi:sugar phosphate isomerase/epimerase